MNRILYIVAPIVLMVVFVFLYVDGRKKIEERKEQERIEKKARDDAEEAERARKREQARIDNEAAETRRLQEEADKKAKKEADFQKKLQDIRDKTAEFNADLAKYKRQAADLDKEITALRTEKEKLTRQSIEMNQTIAAGLIERQNAELEIQRFAAMVGRKARESTLTRMPTIPAAPAQ